MALNLETLDQAGARLGLDKKTIRRYISAGRLTGYQVGPRAIRVSTTEVDALARPIVTVGIPR